MPTKSAVVVNPISDHLPIYLNLGIKVSQNDLFIEKRECGREIREIYGCSLARPAIQDGGNAAQVYFIYHKGM